jgi:protein involved in polysaccharide export with SLBB domain
LDAATREPLKPGTAVTPITIDGLEVFGMRVFQRGTNQFEPNLAGPVDANYRIGPLDILSVIATGQVELAHSLEVTRNGYVIIPQVGQVFVSNLTLAEATQVILRQMRRSYAGAGTDANSTTKVSVNVARLRSNQVFIIGDVVMPGSYQVSAAGTALTALYAAGGPTINGAMRRVEVRRGGVTVSTFDMYDYLLRGDASKDVRLENGDIVFVPSNPKRAAIIGEIPRPALYEMKPSETLADLVAMAGGYTATAARARLEVSRILPPAERTTGRERVAFDVQGPELAQGTAPRTPLLNGDRVTVFGITSPTRDVVAVSGNVWAPGQLGFRPGMRLSEALRKAGGIRHDTYLDEVQVTRRLYDQSLATIHARFTDTLGTVTPDIELTDADEVHVFSRSDYRPSRHVFVGGAVNKPDSIPYTDGLTLRQAVLMAGGLREGAYLPEVEISRLPADRVGGVLAVVFRAPLDSSYIFERGADGKYLGPPGIPSRLATAPEVFLRPYDQINVLEQPEWGLGGSVFVGGEVRFPGSYAIRTRGERISDVVQRAGGLTERAYPEAGVFRRSVGIADAVDRARILKRVELDRDYSLAVEKIAASAKTVPGSASAVAAAIGGEEAALKNALHSADEPKDRIAIDVAEALRNPSHRDNVVLQPGDEVTIPILNATVTVRGFVNSPVTLPYRNGASLSDYVNEAGGVTQNADLRSSFVQQPNGRVEGYRAHRFRPDVIPVPGPGSVIVVPPKLVKFDSGPSVWAIVVPALGTFATAVAAIISLTR